MAKKKPGKKRSAGKKKSAGRKKSAAKRKSVAKKKSVAKRTSAVRKPAKKKRSRKAAFVRRRRPAAAARPEIDVLESTGGRVEALQDKLSALEGLEDELRSRRTDTPADDERINPNLDSIRNAKRATEAQIAAAQTAVLPPPSEADITALRKAVRDAEDVIARNAAVNQLIRAATALIETLNA
jgi:hypothetical protein